MRTTKQGPSCFLKRPCSERFASHACWDSFVVGYVSKRIVIPRTVQHVWARCSNISKGEVSERIDISRDSSLKGKVIPSEWLFRVNGYSEWMAIPSGWLFRVDGHSEWMAIPSEWLFRGVNGYSEWMVIPSAWIVWEYLLERNRYGDSADDDTNAFRRTTNNQVRDFRSKTGWPYLKTQVLEIIDVGTTRNVVYGKNYCSNTKTTYTTMMSDQAGRYSSIDVRTNAKIILFNSICSYQMKKIIE